MIEKKIWNSRLKAKNLQKIEITRTIHSNGESSKQFLVTECFFFTCFWRFLILNGLEQLEYKLEKNIGILKHAGKVRKSHVCTLFYFFYFSGKLWLAALFVVLDQSEWKNGRKRKWKRSCRPKSKNQSKFKRKKILGRIKVKKSQSNLWCSHFFQNKNKQLSLNLS